MTDSDVEGIANGGGEKTQVRSTLESEQFVQPNLEYDMQHRKISTLLT